MCPQHGPARSERSSTRLEPVQWRVALLLGLRQSQSHHNVLLKSSMFISLCGILCTGCTLSYHIVISSTDSLHMGEHVRKDGLMQPSRKVPQYAWSHFSQV